MTETDTILLIWEKYGYPAVVSVILLFFIAYGVRALWKFLLSLLKEAHDERVKFYETLDKYHEVMETQNVILTTMSSALSLIVPNSEKIPQILSENEKIRQNLENLQIIIESIKQGRNKK
jgi:hypothetical protein